MLLPPDLREWVPADHLAHCIIDAVEALDLRQVKVDTRGTGDAQYPPSPEPQRQEQTNFTDPESRSMKSAHGYVQAYNAQVAVEVDRRLMVGARVSNAPNDKQELVPSVAAIAPVTGAPAAVLGDSGFYNLRRLHVLGAGQKLAAAS